MFQGVVLASAGLLWASGLPLARESVIDPLTVAIFVATVILLVLRKIDSLWLILGAATLELAAASAHHALQHSFLLSSHANSIDHLVCRPSTLSERAANAASRERKQSSLSHERGAGR
jgi:chromate transport protein ChrA